MITIAAGLPCALFEWAQKAIRQIISHSGRRIPVHTVHVSDTVSVPDGTDTVFFTETPNDALAEIARIPGSRVAIFRQDAVAAMRYVVEDKNAAFMKALARVSQSAALIHSNLVEVCHPADVHGIGPEQSSDMVDWLAGFLGVQLSAGAVVSILEKAGYLRGEVAPSPDVFGELELGIIRQVLEATCENLCSPERQPVIWPHNILTRLPSAGGELMLDQPMAVELAGPDRLLLGGPRLHLGRAAWAGEAVIGFDKKALGVPFSLEVRHPPKDPVTLAKVFFVPDKPGIYTFSFQFGVRAPQRPIATLLRSEKGAIDGRVALAEIRFSPAGKAASGE